MGLDRQVDKSPQEKKLHFVALCLSMFVHPLGALVRFHLELVNLVLLVAQLGQHTSQLALILWADLGA